MNQKAPADYRCTYIRGDGTKCPEPYKASGLCAGHWRRAKIGQDMDPPIRSVRRGPTEDRFWASVEQHEDGCWLWTGYCEDTGYGNVYDGRFGRSRRTHVVAWELANKRMIPKGGVVRHSCDNPPCVRPDHLILGTHADNVRDKVERGRTARGSSHGTARLTEEIVRTIRADRASGMSQRQLAQRHGVIQQTISQIVRRKTWTHIA